MKRIKLHRGRATTVSAGVAAKVAAAAARVCFTREQALAIAEAYPRGVTHFDRFLKLKREK